MGRKYSPKELEQLLFEFNLRTPLPELKARLKRPESGLVQEMGALSVVDPKTWNPETVKEYRREYEREWYRRHRDRINERRRGWYQQHSDKKRGQQRDWYWHHRDEVGKRQRLYTEQHRDKINDHRKQLYQQHRVRIREQQRQYYQRHREERKEEVRRYRIKKQFPNIETIPRMGYNFGVIELIGDQLRIHIDEPPRDLDAEYVVGDFKDYVSNYDVKLRFDYRENTLVLSPVSGNRKDGDRSMRFLEALKYVFQSACM